MKTLITIFALCFSTLSLAHVTEDGKFEYFLNVQNGQRAMTCVALKNGIRLFKVQQCSRHFAEIECREKGMSASIYGTAAPMLRFGMGSRKVEATTYYRCF